MDVRAKEFALLEKIYRAPALEQWERLSQGLPAPVFPAVAQAIGAPVKKLAAWLGLPERTLRSRPALTPGESEKSFRAYRVFRRAQEVLGGEEEARHWLTTPKRALAGRTPVELLKSDVGASEVLNLLGAIDEGVYT
jgi:putative toxin-antitoxin system antitoxin component (TIGR02293 family)